MRLAVVGSLESWYVQDLRRAAQGNDEIVPVPFRELTSSLGERDRAEGTAEQAGAFSVFGGEYDLRGFDGVLVRTMPPGSLEQVVFRMDALAQLQAAGTPVVNPPQALEAAVDKYLATARLAAAGLRVPQTHCCQNAEAAMAAFARLGSRAVVKPLFGSEGRGVALLEDESMALRAFKLLEQLGAVIYLQEFIEHDGADLRLLVVGDRVLGIRRSNATDWRTNISRGATAEPLEVTPELGEMATRAAAAVGAPLAGVDLLPGRDGVLYAIEVNAVPGWKALARTLNVDVARLVLDYLRAECRE